MYVYCDMNEKFSHGKRRNKYVFKRDKDYDSDGAHLTPFGIEFQT